MFMKTGKIEIEEKCEWLIAATPQRGMKNGSYFSKDCKRSLQPGGGKCRENRILFVPPADAIHLDSFSGCGYSAKAVRSLKKKSREPQG